jgi:hypothetical protein
MASINLYRLFKEYKRNGMDPRCGSFGKFHGFEITIEGANNVDWDQDQIDEIQEAGTWAVDEDKYGIVHVCAFMELRDDDPPSWGYRVYRSTIDMYESENDIAGGTVVHYGDSDVIDVLHNLSELVISEIAEFGGRVSQAFFENCNEGFETLNVVYDFWDNVDEHVKTFARVTKALATARCELHDAPKHAPRLPELPDAMINMIVNSMTGL